MKLRPRPGPFRYDLGGRGEEAAARYLETRGCRVLERNFRCPLGEIDLIVQDGPRTVFVEVKTRTSRRFGRPEASVHPAKQRRLRRLAEWYLKARKCGQVPIRFDVIAVEMTGGAGPTIRHLSNALTRADEEIER